jgi:hypothetical protein
MGSVKYSGYSLMYASKGLRNDRGVVLKAVNNEGHGWVLEYAIPKLRDDMKAVIRAIGNYWYALGYASEELGDNDFFMSEIDVDDIKLYISDRMCGEIGEVSQLLNTNSFILIKTYYV